MAQGDIYSIDIKLINSSQIVSIVNDSIILSAILSFRTVNDVNARKIGELRLLDSNGGFMHRFFRKENTGSQGWELIELPKIKKLKLNAGEQLQFIASGDPQYGDRAYLNAKITLMEV